MLPTPNTLFTGFTEISFSRLAKDVFGVALFLAVLVGVTWRSYARLGEAGPADETAAMCDFREVVYYPARAVLDGVNPYDNLTDADPTRYRNRYPVNNVFPVYSPLLFVFTAPLAMLSFESAREVYWLANVALLLILVAIAWRWSGVKPTIGQVAVLAAIIILSRPGHANFYYGQVALWMTLGSVVALWFARSRPLLAGLALAIATIKPTFGGPLAVMMIARRDYKSVAIGLSLASAVALVGLGVIFARDAHAENVLSVLLTNQQGTDNDPGVDPAQTGVRIDAPLVAERLLGPWPKELWRMALPLGVLFFGCGAVFSLDRGRSLAIDTARRVSDSIVLVTTAICIYHGVYDALLVVLPLVWLFLVVLHRQAAPGLVLPLATFVALAVPSINYLSSKQFARLLSDSFGWADLVSPTAATAGWTAVSIANGVALTIGWVLLLISSRRMNRDVFQVGDVAG